MKRHITYANVTATLALFLAMSGGALAAKHYLISSTKQISPKVIKKLKGATGKTGAAGKEGKQGPEGKVGPKGETGPPAESFAGHEASVGFPSGPNIAEELTHVTLPTGSYTLLATTTAENTSNSSVEAGCVFIAKVTSGAEEAKVFGETAEQLVGPHSSRYLALQGVLSVTAPQELSLYCKSSTTEGSYQSPTLVATRVTTIG